MVELVPITPPIAQDLKETRLRALQDTPSAFGSTYEEESQLSDDEWRERAGRWTGESGMAYLAMYGDSPCGVVGVFLHREDDRRAVLVSMWVAPEARRQKVGRLLVDAARDWARSRGAAALELMVTDNNEAALAFYQRLGFAQTGRTEPYPNDPALTELEMTCAL